MDKNELLNQLKRPFPVDRIHWRIGSTNIKKDTDNELKWGEVPQGSAMCYIDARDVVKRLDDVAPLAWQSRYSHAANGVFICEIGIKIEDEWLWRSNGAGETAFEAEKGGMSDAFKRAATQWGVGIYLYQIPSAWVNMSRRGNTWALNEPPSLPDWATPEGYDRLILKRKPYTERQARDFLKLIESKDAYAIYRFRMSNSEAALDEIEKEYPHKKKTEYKQLVADLSHQGRDIMLETVDSLADLIDRDDGQSVKGVLDDETERMQELIRENLSIEHQDKLAIILQEQAS